jgi:hypothetical protein
MEAPTSFWMLVHYTELLTRRLCLQSSQLTAMWTEAAGFSVALVIICQAKYCRYPENHYINRL